MGSRQPRASPVDVKIQKNILNVFSAQGDDELPLSEFSEILGAVLTGNYADTAIPSVHLVTAILASNWIASKNYVELVKMYVLLAVASSCYQARWRKQRTKDKRFLDEIIFDIRSHLRSFISDLSDNYRKRPLINRSVFDEFGYYHPRKKIIAGMASAALLDRDLSFDKDTKDFLWEFICKTKHVAFLLWEGIVPFCLAEFWALSNIQGTKEPDRRLSLLLHGILAGTITMRTSQNISRVHTMV
jgi:hypothetical protein